MARHPTSAERRQRLKSRALPLVGIALIAFIMGAVKGCPGTPNQDAAGRYAEAWQAGDLKAMYGELSTKSQKGISFNRFQKRYEESEAMATEESIQKTGDVDGNETEADVPMEVRTRAFGQIDQSLTVKFGSDGIAFEPRLLFPGLHENQELTRRTRLPRRASILAADGKALAEGPSLSRQHPLGDAMIDVTGTVGAPRKQ